MSTDRATRWVVSFGDPADLRHVFGAASGTPEQLALAAAAGDVLEAAVAVARERAGLDAGALGYVGAHDLDGAPPGARSVPRRVWVEGLARWRDGDLDAEAAARRIALDLLDHLHHDTKAA